MITQKEYAFQWNCTVGFTFCSAFWLVSHSRIAPIASNGEEATTPICYLITREEDPVSIGS